MSLSSTVILLACTTTFSWRLGLPGRKPNCGPKCNTTHAQACGAIDACITQSQHGEDKYYLKHFGTKFNGTFLEMGAVDGFGMSNTLRFEKELQWSGTLIEANPDMYKRIKYNRPGITSVHAAICNKKQKVHYSRESAAGMRGILEFMKEDHLKKYVYSTNPQKNAVYAKAIKMTCLPLHHIFKTIRVPQLKNTWFIDWFLLDVEGAEYEVVQGIDFDKFSFGVLTIEASGGWKDNLIISLLGQNGYNLHSNDGINNWFTLKE